MFFPLTMLADAQGRQKRKNIQENM